MPCDRCGYERPAVSTLRPMREVLPMTSHCSTCRLRTNTGYCLPKRRVIKGKVRDCQLYQPLGSGPSKYERLGNGQVQLEAVL